MKTVVLIALAITFLSLGSLEAAQKYTPDGAHSQIGFKVTHLVITKVGGSFHEFSGTLMYDEQDITKSSVEFEIQANSIDTGNEKRDNHLKSADFFDVEKYPLISFKSEKITKQGDTYVAVGKFKIRDVEKTIELPFEITGTITDPWGSKRIGIHAETSIDRTEYGLNWNKVLEAGGVMVDNNVDIEIALEFVEEK